MSFHNSFLGIKEIPFNKLTILIVFLMLVGAGMVGYLNGIYDFSRQVRMPDIFAQEMGAGIDCNADGSCTDGSSENCSISNFTNNHNSSPMANGDDRFACFDGTYYFCSANSENKWADKGVIQVGYGVRRGDFICGDVWEFNENLIQTAVELPADSVMDIYDQVQGVNDESDEQITIEPAAPAVPPDPAL